MSQKVNIYEREIKKLDIKNPKKVSVILPNYNYQDFVCERIDSILRQSYPVYELIILDDASPDNSVEVIKKKIEEVKDTTDTKIYFYPNEKNSGCVFDQWKKGFEYAKGELVWIAEADDSCEPNLLEELVKPFEDKDMIISYCESARIDENNMLIRDNSADLYDMCSTGEWKGGFVHDGKYEIIHHLSILNTILNASSVLWKNGDYSDIFEEAKKFEVAGDWWVYYKLLEKGKICFVDKPLNYYRKHSKSVSTNVKAKKEFSEIVKIQYDILNNYELPKEVKDKQKIRREMMYSLLTSEEIEEIEGNNGKKKIAWVIPHPGKGSGGHRTIIQNVNALLNNGYDVDLYFEENGIATAESIKDKINSYYEPCEARVFMGVDKLVREYDLLFATGWQTTEFVRRLSAKKKGYFIQDFEPWFFAMGDQYIITENSYKYGFSCVTIGKWLAHKMGSEYGNPVKYFPFCADLNNYKKLDNVEKENAICFIYQPEKPRRCDYIGLKALKIVNRVMPDLKIYLYGSNAEANFDFECKNLNIIPIKECNELYNKCKVGICMSASNPSRIPFEMMAAGLPVVELYKENNLYDMPDTGILLADTTPEDIASAIIHIVRDEKLQKEMSKAGVEFMKDYPLEKGYEKFIESIGEMVNTEYNEIEKVDKLYNKAPFKATEEVIKVSEQIREEERKNNINAQTQYKPSKIKKLRNKIRSMIRK